MTKVLQINSFYGFGSTGVLVETLHSVYQKAGYDSYVLYGRGPKNDDERIVRFTRYLEPKFNSVLSRITGVMYGHCFFSTNRLIKKTKKINPDIVHIHCTNTFICNNFKLFRFLGKMKYKVIITLHAEYLYTGSCSHALDCEQWINGCKKCPNIKRSSRSIIFDKTPSSWKKMYSSLSTIDVSDRKIVAVSDWLANQAKKSKTFKDDEIVTINNGIDTNIFHENIIASTKYKDMLSGNKRFFLFVAPDFNLKNEDIKGCDYFLDIIERLKDKKDIYFIVVGRNKGKYDFSKHKNVIYLGELKDQKEMAQLYSICEATLLLSRKETYSLVTAESLSCGTPVYGFFSGGPETIADMKYAKFYKQGDVDSIVKLINEKNTKPKISVSRQYSFNKMANKYLELVSSFKK